MAEVIQLGWTRIQTRTGRYEYQFQGVGPTVRNGAYLDARDYQFLVMDEEGWLYKIPVRMARAAIAEIESRASTLPASERETAEKLTPLRIAEAQLRAGLELFRPKRNAPYGELDAIFAVDAARWRELAAGAK